MKKNLLNWVKLLPPSFVLNVATLGPVGYLGKAPGTNGTVVGILFYFLLASLVSPWIYIALCFLFVYLAIVFCGEAEVIMKKHDAGEIILDEFVAIPFCFIQIGWIIKNYPLWLVVLLAFFLFRLFDIFKPFGIKSLQKLKGGLGVVADDIAAALATCISLHLIFWVLTQFA